MLQATSPIHHLVDPLIEGLSNLGVVTNVHHLCLLDRETHKQTKAELAHILSSPTRHVDLTSTAVNYNMHIICTNFILANHLNQVKDCLIDAAIHFHIITLL